ncbi:glycosyltransferase [Spirochaetota bacterium]
MKRSIIFTGGGSGGHTVPALSIINKIDRTKYNIFFIGSKKGIENTLLRHRVDGYYAVITGKIRHRFTLMNIMGIICTIIGIFQVLFIYISKLPKKDVILFSTGGYVSIPAVLAFFIARKSIYIHEQTSRVGLANKFASLFAYKVLISFDHSRKFLPPNKVICTGYPIREEIFNYSQKHSHSSHGKKPQLYITGGGNGSLLINSLIKDNIDTLKKDYTIIHQTGSRFIHEFKDYIDDNYICRDFITDDFPQILQSSDIIITRAGAGIVSEVIALDKNAIFIPLKIARGNEQYFNALEATKKVNALIINEDELSISVLLNSIDQLLTSDTSGKPQSSHMLENPADTILRIIENTYNKE